MSTVANTSRPAPSRPQVLVWSRRRFLRTATGAVALPYLLPAGLLSAAPNSKLHHASIGVGGMGWVDLNNFVRHPRLQVAALCDVDATHLEKAAKLVPQARRYRDWRELLEAEGDRIDSVNVTVPDHMHFSIAWEAIQRGKNVYCQKPLCHDVSEVRALTELAVRRGVITQLGTQMASGIGDRTTVRLLRQGVIGQIKHAYLTANRPGAAETYRPKGPRPRFGQPPPSTLKWNEWIGTAPWRPYAPGVYHPVKWRGWLDFGTGWSGDIGCHIFDAMWKGLEMSAPRSVVADVQASWKQSPARRADNWPQANHIRWVFPGNAHTVGKEWVVEWFDGDFYPPKHIRALYSVEDYPAEAFMLIGTEGAMLMEIGHSPILLPEEKFRKVVRPKLRSRNHYHHFVDACLGGEKTESHFAQTGPMTEAILLGTVAVRMPGRRLEWDPKNLRIPNEPDAEVYLRRLYRKGWERGGF